jgi:cytochrome P450
MSEPAASSTAPVLDFSDPKFISDPYPTFRMLRERAPISRALLGMWTLSRHADIAAVLKDGRFGHDFEGRISGSRRQARMLGEPVFRMRGYSMVVRDPPDHTRLRGLVAKAFTARRVESMRPRIEVLVDALLGKLIPDGRMDVVNDLAQLIPATVMCDMLGIAEADRAKLFSHHRVAARSLDPTPMTRAELDEANTIVTGNRRFFEDLFRRRAGQGGEDLISALLEARDEHNGRLSDEELAANIMLLFGAGQETTTNLIAIGLLALHRHADQWQRLLAEPDLAANAVDELLRFDSSVQLTGRKAFCDLNIGPENTRIKRGETVICLLGAANRDPAVYSDPEKLDITRTGIRHLSFGGGVHHCLGAQLARLEAEIVFRKLAERMPTLVLDNIDSPVWRSTMTLRGLVALPARWRPQSSEIR